MKNYKVVFSPSALTVTNDKMGNWYTVILKVKYTFLPKKKNSLSRSLYFFFIGDSIIHSLSWEQVNETQNNMN